MKQIIGVKSNFKLKLISFFVIFILLFNFFINNIFAYSKDSNIIVNGYKFEIVSNNSDEVVLNYKDEIGSYNFSLNKQNGENESPVELTGEIFSKERNIENSILDYDINFDEDIETLNDIDNTNKITFVDKNTNQEYNLNNNARFVIPIGIPLLYAAVQALLDIGCAIIILNSTYVMAEEIVDTLRRKDEYKYFDAYLKNGYVYIGGGISSINVARSKAQSDNNKGAIFCTKGSYARAVLTGYKYAGPEIHGSGDGYWNHYHILKSNGERYKAHIWYA